MKSGTSFGIAGINVEPLGCVTRVKRHLFESVGLHGGQCENDRCPERL